MTQQFTGKSGDDLKAFRNEVQAVADSFNADFRETLIATNALSKQFGISANEALQLDVYKRQALNRTRANFHEWDVVRLPYIDLSLIHISYVRRRKRNVGRY